MCSRRPGPRLILAQLRVAVEERLRVGEGATLQLEEAFLVPAGDVPGAGVHVHGEVEQVADRQAVSRAGRREHIQALDDEDVGAADDNLRVGHDVVAEVRVERRTHLFGAALDRGDEAEQGTPVVRLREALAVHQAASGQLGVGEQESVGRHQLHPRGVFPAGEQLPQQASDGRLADGDGSGDTDHERSALRPLAEEVARRAVQLAGARGIEVQQLAQRQVDPGNLVQVQRLAEPAQLNDFRFAKRESRGARQGRPIRAVEFDKRGAVTVVGSAEDGLGHSTQLSPAKINCMCGIVGYVGDSKSVEVLMGGLRRLEYRGYDSAGIAVIDESGALNTAKRAGKLAMLTDELKANPISNGRTGIGHTRWATHGGPTDENAHPHLGDNGRLSLIHNGIIENFAPLRAELLAEGYTCLLYTSPSPRDGLLSRMP